ncbi:MAG: acyl-CoA carboxylase epsilon subunit [Rothia sp. (in: high G+C Gram-positive bacteria)]|uniref:acyl-CoA carboxylase epsilon subunit n=1 Tax=Rothia sp. (in: high G+C Gram-positive bacteria) TaxID=1885016 RepID=UPI0026DEF9BC|nr:acyl-CoA carboxylase epsilon subunit [Rothia sp. (in: high G+C Gram-positive bacteria)]MDO5750339.1 acyl-CoA carboxylase epsilon subunit [Rothia sp. (in: high G+C Gram-positive bacteria)]
MANPLSYFSFGRKKAEPAASESADARPEAESSVAVADSAPAAPEPATPLFSVVSGDPNDEELAALTAVVAALSAQAAAKGSPSLVEQASRLLNRRQRLGAGLRPGPGSWRRARPM